MMDLRSLPRRPRQKNACSKKYQKSEHMRRHAEALKGSILNSVKRLFISCTLTSNLDIKGMVGDVITIIKHQDLVKVRRLQEEADKYSALLEGQGQILTLFMQKMYKSELKKRRDEIARIKAGGNVSSFRVNVLSIVRKHSACHGIVEDGIMDYKLVLVRRFLDIVSNYCSVNVKYINNVSKEISCSECENSDIETTDFGSYLCTSCAYEWPIIVKYGSVSVEDDRSKSSNMYETRKNFDKSLKKFEGIHCNIPDKEALYTDLDKYFLKLTGHVRRDFINMPLNSDGSRGHCTKKMMLDALSATGHAVCYRDVSTILSEYWCWKCRDLSDLKDRIFESYDTYVKEFNILFKDKSLPTNDFFQYILINKCMIEDDKPLLNKKEFKIIKTPSILDGHVYRLSVVCTQLMLRDKRWGFFTKLQWD